MTQNEDDIDVLDDRTKQQQKDLSRARLDIDQNTERIDDVEERVDDVEDDIVDLDGRVSNFFNIITKVSVNRCSILWSFRLLFVLFLFLLLWSWYRNYEPIELKFSMKVLLNPN